MSANIVNQVPYLRTSRNFPEDPKQLIVELSKDHIDIANAINSRTIGIFPIGNPAITGDSWFLNSPQGTLSSGSRQQTLRQVFKFTAVGNIAHNIRFATNPTIVNAYGSFTDGTNAYGVIYASNVAIAGQISFYVTPTNIVILNGGGTPVIQSGTIVLEWLSSP